MFTWLLNKIEHFHCHVLLHRLETRKEQVARQLAVTPDGPLKRPLLTLLDEVDAQILEVKQQLGLRSIPPPPAVPKEFKKKPKVRV